MKLKKQLKYGCKPGQYKPLDLNEDGVIDDKDRVIDGKRTPDWQVV